MSLPKKIKVAPHDLDVRIDTEACTAANVTGACLEDSGVIILTANVSASVQRDTLLHEVLHAAWGQTELNRAYDDDQEEKVIHSLTPRLLAVLRDNPRLVTYLTETP